MSKYIDMASQFTYIDSSTKVIIMIKRGTIYSALAVATFAVSWAAILFKLAGSGPLPAAFYRLALASIILSLFAVPRFFKALKRLSRGQIILLATSGLFLGLHFAFWVTSLFYTTISNSTVIVSTNPLWVMIMEVVFLKEKIPARSIAGMIAALAGMVLISGGDFDIGRDAVIGDIFALLGAIFAGVYFFIGRKLRAKMDNLSYIFPVYSLAAITLLIISLVNGENLIDYPAKTWIVFLLLALIPTIVGHSLFNWLLKYIKAHIIAVTVLGEPIGATILAIIIFAQIPGWSTIIGGVMILSGIFLVLIRKSGNIQTLQE